MKVELLIIRPQHPKFTLGRLVGTPRALNAVTEAERVEALQRHSSGDWGNLDQEDKAANDAALAAGTRLFSQYESKLGTKFWIITEADRSATTILLPEEY